MSERKADQRKLRNFLIDPPLQLHFSLFYVLVAFLYFLANLAIVIPELKDLEYMLANPDPTIPLVEYVRDTLFSITLASVILGVCYFVVVAITSIVTLHKISGPTFAINRALRDMISGDTDIKVVLRRFDALNETADLVNELAEKLSHKK